MLLIADLNLLLESDPGPRGVKGVKAKPGDRPADD